MLFALYLAVSCGASGLDRDRTIAQFFHTAWTVKEGGPSGLTQMAQTTDGYLWLGTQSGLIRFDGVRFDRYRPASGNLPSRTVSALLATPDGGLWIGFVPHGAAFLKQGRIVMYGENEGLPYAPIFALGRDADGSVWAGTSRGLWKFDGSRWQATGLDRGFPDTSSDDFYLDSRGNFWVSAINGLFCLPSHARAFRRYPGTSVRLGETRDGTLWEAEHGGPLRPFSRSTPVIGLNATQILIDRDDSMWVLTSGAGVARIANPEAPRPAIQRFTAKDGLSDDRITNALEDREGNIWIATRGGLDRFRKRNVVPGPFPYGDEGQDLALAADRTGTLWAGNLGQPLMRLQDHTISYLNDMRDVTCAYRAPDGTLWFGGHGHLARIVGDRVESIPLPSEIARHWEVEAITADHQGSLWVSVTQNGVFRFRNGVWTHWGGIAALPKRTAVVLWTDAAGRIWFGYTVNLVAVLDGDNVRMLSSAEGLSEGTISAIAGSGNRVWVGGESGLAIFDGQQFHMVPSEPDREFGGVSGIIEMPGGDLWINQANGVARIPAAEIAATLASFNHHPGYDLFDFRDGVSGPASPVRPLPSAIVAGDGRIWLSGTNGATWIDPARIYRNPLPPPVAIEAVFVDGRRYNPSAVPLSLPASPSNVRIEYTALSLSIPERVRFRYRLEGVDKGWQDAETRRTAFYTGVKPGRLHFQVIACNNDGVWNTTGASIDLIVALAFYQTSWFIGLCALAGGCMLRGIYLLRLRQMAARMQLRLEERLAERERIARELHDTLLQGLQGMILRFQSVAKHIAANQPARRMMEEALDRADQVMEEGRDRVSGLRAPADRVHALAEAFTRAGEELVRDYPQPAFRVTVEGIPEELHPVIADEAYRIGREAMVNAFCHAEANAIEVELIYRRFELQVRFRDDGRGIDPEVLDAGGRTRHWGLTGMRERARKIGARIDIASRPGTGTEIELRIPAAAAYRNKVRGFLPHRARHLEAKESE